MGSPLGEQPHLGQRGDTRESLEVEDIPKYYPDTAGPHSTILARQEPSRGKEATSLDVINPR